MSKSRSSSVRSKLGWRRNGAWPWLAALLIVLPGLSAGQTKGTATFGHLKNLEFIQAFYNGGTGSLGSGPGPNFGLQFTANAQVIVSAAKGGSGNFINNPGGYPVMFFETGGNLTVNFDSGLDTALLFYYSALQNGIATVYSGANGTGTVLSSVKLTPNNAGCNTYKMCVWTPVGIPLTATGSSIVFGGTANYLAIGTMKMGVPLPTKLTLASSQNPSVQGEPVTFTATVTATGSPVAGTVTFKAAGKEIGSATVSGGTASVTTSSLKSGSIHINAIFKGTGFATASGGLVQQVN